MYHSLTFNKTNSEGDTRNTWDDWHLVSEKRPVFNPPTPKIRTVDIPGANGVIDLTEGLTGQTVFNNRTGSLDFVVVNDWFDQVKYYKSWMDVYTDILNFLHGQAMVVTLEDEPEYYYEGRFTVSGWEPGEYYSHVTIDYSLYPYKFYAMNFPKLKGIAVDSKQKIISVPASDIGSASDVSITTDIPIHMSIKELFYDKEYVFDLSPGTTKLKAFEFRGSDLIICIKSTSTAGSISFSCAQRRL